MVGVELNQNGIEPIFKNCVKCFCMHKTDFLSSRILFSLSNLIQLLKPAPGEHESNFMKLGSIPWEPNDIHGKRNYIEPKYRFI